MTNGTCQHEEMEHRVHILRLVQTIEHGTCDITYPFRDNPTDGCCRHGIQQRFEGHEHTQTHTDETERLHIRMFLQTDETHNGSGYCTGPDKDKETPAPVALLAQRDQCQWRVASRDMPINSRMIPPAQALLPFRVVLHRVVECRGRIRTQHTEEIEDHTPPCPVVIALETPDEEDDAEHHSHQNPTAMRRSIPYLFLLCISDHFLMVTVYL